MAFDESLADRVRDVLTARPELSERRMFGGLAFFIAGNMACAVIGDELAVRLGDDGEAALAEAHTRPFDFSGKPVRTAVYVDAEGLARDEDVAKWAEAGADYAASLPPK